MSVRNGVKIIVNADTDIDDVTAGKVYTARGGVHDLDGAVIFNDAVRLSYLERGQFEYANISDEPTADKETEVRSEEVNPMDKFFLPEA